MIIRIESVYGDKRLVGRTLSVDELKPIVKDILEKYDEQSFVSVFCSRLGYKELPEPKGYSAFAIDLDTHKVFIPSYTFPKELNGAKVLYYTDKGEFPPVLYPGGSVAHNVSYLAICVYPNDTDYYVFHCDESLEVVADGCFSNIEMCKKYMRDYDITWHEYKKN